MKTLGAVLAGGRSRRFGRDKLQESVDGRPMIEHVIETVSFVVDEVVVSAATSEHRKGFMERRVVADRVENAGPLGGLYSVLLETEVEWVLLVAGDMPLITEDSLRSLLKSRDPDLAAVVARDQTGRMHPLAACYHRSTLPAIKACLEDRAFAMKTFISRIRKVAYVTLPAADLANVNRPGDLAPRTGKPPIAR